MYVITFLKIAHTDVTSKFTPLNAQAKIPTNRKLGLSEDRQPSFAYTSISW